MLRSCRYFLHVQEQPAHKTVICVGPIGRGWPFGHPFFPYKTLAKHAGEPRAPTDVEPPTGLWLGLWLGLGLGQGSGWSSFSIGYESLCDVLY